jgi:DNA-binding CsgD family transcriptional regulator
VLEAARELREEARLAALRGSPARALMLMTEAAERAEEADTTAAVSMLAEAALSAYFAYGPRRAIEVAEQAVRLARGAAPNAALLAWSRLGDALSWAGRHSEAERSWRSAVELEAPETVEAVAERSSLLLRLGQLDAGRETAYRAAELARRLADIGVVVDALGLVVVAETEAGRLREALAAGEEALERAPGPTGDRLSAIGLVVWSEALLGLEGACRAHLAEADALGETLRFTAAGGFAEGLLELSLGNHANAVRRFEAKLVDGRVPAAAAALRIRRFVDSLVEALVRSGRPDEAADVLGSWFDAAAATGQPRFAAAAYRCSGLVHEDVSAFEAALRWHDRWSNPFERARTELCFGEVLRRHKRRTEAREQLRRAAEDFERVGARIWRERARAELAATGERARRRAPGEGGQLTPQERQVAQLAARGLTTKEIASQLVLSPKTIETHLRHVFQKLGVRSRTELAANFRDSPDSSGAAPS